MDLYRWIKLENIKKDLFYHSKSVTKLKEESPMTIISQVKQTLAGLKSAQASFETFALGTDNQQAKQLYQDAAKQTQQLVDSLSARVQQIEQEEPQYKQQ
jgi:rRNA maturation protein Rpf1